MNRKDIVIRGANSLVEINEVDGVDLVGLLVDDICALLCCYNHILLVVRNGTIPYPGQNQRTAVSNPRSLLSEVPPFQRILPVGSQGLAA